MEAQGKDCWVRPARDAPNRPAEHCLVGTRQIDPHEGGPTVDGAGRLAPALGAALSRLYLLALKLLLTNSSCS